MWYLRGEEPARHNHGCCQSHRLSLQSERWTAKCHRHSASVHTHTHRQTEKQADRQTDRERQRDRQADRQTDETGRHTLTQSHTIHVSSLVTARGWDGKNPVESAGNPWEWVQVLREYCRDETKTCGNTVGMKSAGVFMKRAIIRLLDKPLLISGCVVKYSVSCWTEWCNSPLHQLQVLCKKVIREFI